MTPYGPALDEDQRDLAAMLDALAADRAVVLDDDPRAVAALAAELAGLGVWTLGTAEAAGGAGAGRATTAVALERLGRCWPALGWAAAQAHAAVDILGGDERFAGLVARVHAAEAAVAVVDAGSAHVHLGWKDGALTGGVDRVDAAHEAPYLLVLTGEDRALLVEPVATTAVPLRRTGLGGALTRSLDVDASGDAVRELRGVDAAAARVRLWLGAASVAAGIAGAAADAAAAYAAGRRQFSGPLTEIATVRRSLLDQAARSTVILTAVLAAAPDPLHSFAVAREACDGAIDVAAAAVQVHGGYGYLAEYAVERRLRDAVSLRAAADVQGAAIAQARVLAGHAPVTALSKEAS